MAADDIRLLSEALAADPSSVVFLQLGELLRQRGQVDLAYHVAVRGVERHPHRAEAHDLLARIAIDRGDFERAHASWDMVLSIAPHHTGALKGLGFLHFQRGDLDMAARYLAAALEADPTDASLIAALATVHAVSAQSHGGTREGAAELDAPAPPFARQPADARALFAEVLGDAPQTALMLDRDGYVVAGQYVTADGRDLGADIGAQLSGVGDEAARAMRHLDLGAWRQIVFEAEAASVAMAPSGDGVLLVAAPRSVPLGFVRRLLERSLTRARRWLESGT